MPNFFDKEKYVFHYQNLQLCLRLVLKLKKKIHREFNQSHGLKRSVKFKTQKQIEAEKNGVTKMKKCYTS